MPAFLFNASANGQQRVYLDESGTLGFGGEIFTMAMVLVRDLPKLEACTLRNRTTQSEVKASQMKTAQKLALARTLLEENDIDIYLVKLDPHAAMASERKLDKELLYDSMVAQALNFYLTRGDMTRGLPYRISMDMRGGLRESYEDMVAESVGNVLMHRPDPLVTGLDVRFLDSKYSAGVQAADLFSNVYRTALTQTDSPCRSFLRKYQELGRVHAGFTFGLVELADQMAQIAADLRARVLLEGAVTVLDDGLSSAPVKPTEEKIIDVVEEILELGDASPAETEGESHGVSRSARRRRSRATRRVHTAGQTAPEQPKPASPENPEPQEKAPTVETAPSPDVTPSAGPSLGPVAESVRDEAAKQAEPKASAKAEPREKDTKAQDKDAEAKPTPVLDQNKEAADAQAGETPEAEQSKPDVRPGRASRSRQAAQATSRRQRTTRKAAAKPSSLAANDAAEPPVTLDHGQQAPAAAEPQPSETKPEMTEAPAPEVAAAPTAEAPVKKAAPRRRRRTPAKQESNSAADTSNETPKTASQPEHPATEVGAGSKAKPPSTEPQGE